MTRVRLGFLLLLAFSTPVANAQSTSPWQRIGDASFGNATAATPGSGYLTVIVRAASIYQNSNWWTGWIENHRQGVVTANLTATIAGVPVAQTITGNPIELRKNNSMVDLGFAGAVVDHLPNTFAGMNMTLQINKTSQDGLQGLLTQVSQLSTGTPPVLALSPETMALTSLGKSFADFLFKANLLVKKASTQNAFPGGGLLPPGIYVSFAGDTSSDYNPYLIDWQNLRWSGAVLTYKRQTVDRVGFFVIEVAYQNNYFADPQDVLSSTTVPWVQLYEVAEGEIPSINNTAQAVTVLNDVQSHLSAARTLLIKDPTLVKKEKDAIHTSEAGKINTLYQERLVALGLAQPTAMAGNPVPTIPRLQLTPKGEAEPGLRTVLKTVDPAEDALHVESLKKLGMGTRMKPTSQF
jgi:hypothetical protein